MLYPQPAVSGQDITGMLGDIGVRGRLFLAFLGISGLALLGAIVALIAFNDVGSLVDRVTRERMPASLAALELSRQAERIAAAAPNLLASTTRQQQMRADQDIRSGLEELEKLLVEVESSHPDQASLSAMESGVRLIRWSLSQLQELVADRQRLVSRRTELLGRVVLVAD